MFKNLFKTKKKRLELSAFKKIVKKGSYIDVIINKKKYPSQILDIKSSGVIMECPRTLKITKDEALKAKISLADHDIPWEFVFSSVTSIIEDKETYLTCKLPFSIEKNNRRDSFRINISSGLNHKAHFYYNDNVYISKIVDLSRTGAKIRIENGHNISLVDDMIIEGVAFHIENTIDTVFDIKVQWIRKDGSKTYMGIHFMNINKSDSDAIGKFLYHLERQKRQIENKI